MVGRRGRVLWAPRRRATILTTALWIGATSAAIAATDDGLPARSAPPRRLLSLPLDLGDRSNRASLTAEDLTVLLDGQPQRVVGLDRPARDADAGSQRVPWTVLIYVDGPLTTPDGLSATTRGLTRHVERTMRLGPTEIVLADPLPRVFLEPTRDPIAIRDALRDLPHETLSAGEIEWLRQRFRQRPDARGRPAEVARALREEEELVERQGSALLRSLVGRTGPGPRLLIWVHSGFDLNPRPFYASVAGESFLEDPRAALRPSDLARTIAALGWTVLAAAIGRKPAHFDNPLAPGFALVAEAGGAVATHHRDVQELLDRVASWPVLQVELQGAGSQEPRPIEVRLRGSTLPVNTSHWASVSSPGVPDPPTPTRDEVALHGASAPPRPVLKLLRPEGLTASGSVRFHTVSGRKRIHRVAFLLDGEQIAVDEQAPFSAILDLGPGTRARTVTAIAYSKTGQELGADSVEVNTALEPPRVEIVEMSYSSGRGALVVAAAANSPAGSDPDRLQFYLNDSLITELESPPYRTEIPTPPLAPGDFVRVVAHYPGGATAEAARLAAASGPAEDLEVNLVELLAVVTHHPQGADSVLAREDFLIRRGGRRQPIEQFVQWQELPLTLGLVLDTSDSMQPIIDDARRAGERFFRHALRAGDRAFVVDFNDLPRLLRQPTGDAESLLETLDGIQAHGATALYDAILYSLLQFGEAAGRRALVVVTDGKDSASRHQPRECIGQARLHGVPIYLVVLGESPAPGRRPALLRNQAMVGRTGGRVFYVSDLERLDQVYDRIGAELRQQFFLAFTADRALTPAELQEVEVVVQRKGVSVRTLLASQQRGG